MVKKLYSFDGKVFQNKVVRVYPKYERVYFEEDMWHDISGEAKFVSEIIIEFENGKIASVVPCLQPADINLDNLGFEDSYYGLDITVYNKTEKEVKQDG